MMTMKLLYYDEGKYQRLEVLAVSALFETSKALFGYHVQMLDKPFAVMPSWKKLLDATKVLY